MGRIDFKHIDRVTLESDWQEVDEAALRHYPDLLFMWLPGGYIQGNHFIASVPVGDGPALVDGFSVDLVTGEWLNLGGQTPEHGRTPISLVHHLHRCSFCDAARYLTVITNRRGR